MPARTDRARARYLERKVAGRCAHCAAGLTEDDGVLCVECDARQRAWNKTDRGRATRRRVTARLRARRRAAGKCIDCETPSPDASRCASCRQANAAAVRAWRARKAAA